MNLTSRQLAAFWRVFAMACREQNIDTRAAQNDYRHRVLIEEAGVSSIKLLDRTKGYERCMLRLNLDAGNYEAAARYESASEKRLAHMIQTCVNQILQLADTRTHTPTSYVCAILYNARINVQKRDDSFWLDLSQFNLLKLFQMLDTHRRRLLSRFDTDIPKAFNPRAFYTVRGGHVHVDYVLAIPDAFKVVEAQ